MANDAYGLLEAAAVHHGESLAIVDGDKLMTYHALQMRVINLAQWLAGQGVRRGSRVAVLSRNSSSVMEIHYAAAYLHAGKFIIYLFYFCE